MFLGNFIVPQNVLYDWATTNRVCVTQICPFSKSKSLTASTLLHRLVLSIELGNAQTGTGNVDPVRKFKCTTAEIEGRLYCIDLYIYRYWKQRLERAPKPSAQTTGDKNTVNLTLFLFQSYCSWERNLKFSASNNDI